MGGVITADGFVLFLHTEFRNVFSGLREYKFFCFNGKPEIMYIGNDGAKLSGEETTTDFFDMNFNHLDMRMKDPNAITMPAMPRYFEEMKNIAIILSQNLPHVRLDFYETSKQKSCADVSPKGA